jgi:hypothetical protein
MPLFLLQRTLCRRYLQLRLSSRSSVALCRAFTSTKSHLVPPLSPPRKKTTANACLGQVAAGSNHDAAVAAASQRFAFPEAVTACESAVINRLPLHSLHSPISASSAVCRLFPSKWSAPKHLLMRLQQWHFPLTSTYALFASARQLYGTSSAPTLCRHSPSALSSLGRARTLLQQEQQLKQQVPHSAPPVHAAIVAVAL